MIEDGSLRRLQDERHQRRAEASRIGLRALGGVFDDAAFKMAREAELRPGLSLDGLLRPSIPMRQETHRLLRAVAIKRAKKVPGEQPSIGAIVEGLVEASRPALEKEAGAILGRELAKKR
jgi:hypothetical protein